MKQERADGLAVSNGSVAERMATPTAQGVVGLQERAQGAPEAIDAIDQDGAKAPRLRVDQEPLPSGRSASGTVPLMPSSTYSAGNRQVVQIHEPAQEVELTLDRGALGLIFRADTWRRCATVATVSAPVRRRMAGPGTGPWDRLLRHRDLLTGRDVRSRASNRSAPSILAESAWLQAFLGCLHGPPRGAMWRLEQIRARVRLVVDRVSAASANAQQRFRDRSAAGVILGPIVVPGAVLG